MRTLFISDFLNTPLKFFLPKMWHKATSKIEHYFTIRKDIKVASFLKEDRLRWNRLFKLSDLPQIKDSLVPFTLYRDHCFDVLGSGWLCWNYGQEAPGFNGNKYANHLHIKEFDSNGLWLESVVNDSNLEISKSIWRDIINLNPNYQPIDWQKDVKSGYRFGQKKHALHTKTIPGLPGVDVKVPWEFGRLQHLPFMTTCAIKDQEKEEEIIEEIKCQLLDFIMSNPPRWGLQWTSAMEVGIRLMNMTMTLDMLLQLRPELLDSVFYQYVSNSVAEHITFAWHYREHKNGLSNNHYLANLTGILYGAFAMINTKDFGDVFIQTAEELWKEIDKQFLDDGGNFESSTAYHCFSTEISTLALSLLIKAESEGTLPKDYVDRDLKKVVLEKIHKAVGLMSWLEIEDGLIPQLGDNDSAIMLMFNLPG